MAVTVVERWLMWRGLNKSECVDFLSAGTKKVTVVERWPLVEVQLYIHEHCPILNTLMHGWSV